MEAIYQSPDHARLRGFAQMAAKYFIGKNQRLISGAGSARDPNTKP